MQTGSNVGGFEDVSALLEDGANTLREFWVPVSLSALHLYHSVIVFMPECLLLDRVSRAAHPIATMLSDRISEWDRTIILEGHTESVNCAVFFPDNARVVSISADGTVRIWDFASSRQLARLNVCATNYPNEVVVHPDGLEIAISCIDGRILLWDLVDDGEAYELSPGERRNSARSNAFHIRSMEYSPSGKQLLCVTSKDNIVIWDIKTASVLRRLDIRTLDDSFDEVGSLVGLRQGSFICASFLPDGLRIAQIGSTQLRVWDSRGGGRPHTVLTCDNQFLEHTCKIAMISSSSSRLFIIEDNLEDMGIGARMHVISIGGSSSGPYWLQNTSVSHFAISASEQFIATGTLVDMSIWSISQGNPVIVAPLVAPLNGHMGMFSTSVGFSSNDQRAVTTCGNRIYIWDLPAARSAAIPQTRNRQGFIHPESKSLLSADGSSFAYGYGSTEVRVRSTCTNDRDPLAMLTQHDVYNRYIKLESIAPDGKRLVISMFEDAAFKDYKGISIWDWEAHRLINLEQSSLAGNPGCLSIVGIPRGHHLESAWSPDSRLVAACRETDERIRVCDTVTGQIEAELQVTQSDGTLRFSANGLRLIQRHFLDGPEIPGCYLWDTKTWTVIARSPGYRCCNTSPDGLYILTPASA
jgi:WD40 repeat protein